MTYRAFVDIGGTKVVVGIADEQNILYRVRQNTAKTGENTALPYQIDFLIGYCAERIGIPKSDIQEVGISTCSPFLIMPNGDKYLATPNICGGLSKNRGLVPNNWKSIPLDPVLKTVYPKVTSENDCVSQLLAEFYFGAARGHKNCTYVTWSTGIGGGVMVDGKIKGGKNGNAGHIGHILIAEDGPECGCGQRGCLEALTSGPSMAKEYNELAKTNVDTIDVFNAYRAGDEIAKQVIDRAARNFGRGLISINNGDDTGLFVIGGSVFMNDEDRKILEPIVRHVFYNESFVALTEKTVIVKSELGKDLEIVAGLSVMMPKELIEDWYARKPWKDAPEIERLD